MASCLLTSFPAVCCFPKQPQQLNHISNRSKFNRFNVFHATQSHCEDVATKNISNSGQEVEIVRRSANYHPSIWDYDFFQSLTSDYLDNESYKERGSKLMGEVRKLLDNVVDPLEKLELVDNLQRLGLSYQFNDEIKRILKNISAEFSIVGWKKDNLYAKALAFRLLRQHGYNVKQDVFSSFLDEVGNFKASLSMDCKGLLNLYEASYLLVEDERILENARDFAAKHLKEYLKKQKNDEWWNDLDLVERLSFARNSLMVNFLWSLEMIFGPQFEQGRRSQTKGFFFINIIDDIYDVYGTLDELELFTEAVERWDINAIQGLPNYIKLCFHALYNSVNEIASHTLKEQHIDVIPFLKKMWTNLCKAYLLEAKWFYSGYIPTLQEYMDNGWISGSCPTMLAYSYLATGPITKEGLQNIEEYHPNLVYWSCVILRLANDLGTSSNELKRGDVPKSIQCYMHESGVSEEEAREHIRKLIDETWKKMNRDIITKSPPFSEMFIEAALNVARMSQFLYRNGDGHGIEEGDTEDRVLSLFVHPIAK
ncbi:hypothetical protein COLO4_02890 [Corchorus olitorius]|uniref:Uncharacterized protein n=1 Tax=Corchorus olitorius TaxID=93759 RepID=A0A1R3L002_9ROSI|nr:hypothetical protein COLO4_02890 [Corchorus olitorius]